MNFKRTSVGSYLFPKAADAIGWLMIIVSILPVFVYMAWSYWHNEGNWKKVRHLDHLAMLDSVHAYMRLFPLSILFF